MMTTGAIGKDAPPKIDPPDFDSIPEALKALTRWLLWQWERRRGKWQKPPVRLDGRRADKTNPADWCDFASAQDAFERLGVAGIGIALGDGLYGADLDGALDDDGNALPWAQAVVDRFATYTEVTPSGRGLHILIQAADTVDLRGHVAKGGDGKTLGGIPFPAGCAVELYGDGAYFTVTGSHWPGTVPDVQEDGTALQQLHDDLFGDRPPRGEHLWQGNGNGELTPEDVALLGRLRVRDKFVALYDRGDCSGYGSQSEADLALCSMLSRAVNRDPKRVDRLFRHSQLLRPKWDRRHGAQTYGQATVAKACAPSAPPQRSLSDEELRSLERQAPPQVGKALPREEDLSDLWNGDRFVELKGRDFLYVPDEKVWYHWTGTRWQRDRTRRVEHAAKAVARDIAALAAGCQDPEKFAALTKWARYSMSEKGRAAMLSAAATELAVVPEEFDSRAMLLNTPSGTLDVATGHWHEHRREDMLTKQTPYPYDPDLPAPRWQAFLDAVTQGDAQVQAYLQLLAGYALCGSNREQVLIILHGPGGNGKSTFLNALHGIAGSYGHRCRMETFMLQRRDPSGASEDIAALQGVRLLSALEGDEGRRLSEAFVKELTGEAMLTARHLYGRDYTFAPQMTPILGTNHRPRIADTTDSIWRRVRLVPFTKRFRKPDEGEPQEGELRGIPDYHEVMLAEEGPAILAWAVEGARLWMERGLFTPDAVRRATSDYRGEQNLIAQFLADCCAQEPDAWVRATPIYEAYKAWCSGMGETPMTQTRLSDRLKEAGFVNDRNRPQGRHWKGLRLLGDEA